MNEPAFIGMTRITYEIMTDSHGVKWKVPTFIDSVPCEYLRRHEPIYDNHTFEVITVFPKVETPKAP